MAIEDIITSPLLTPALTTANATLKQTLTIIDFLSEHAHDPATSQLQRQVAQNQKVLQAYLSRLRTQTRTAAFEARSTKAQTAEARSHVDRLLLQLQNLYYEQRHLLSEIEACEGYEHAYLELPMISEDEYLERFPEHDELDEAELMSKRIEWEAAERERMEAERKTLSELKEKIAEENAKRKEEVKKMDERLEAWIEGLKPLEVELSKDLV